MTKLEHLKRTLSLKDLGALGVEDVAYVKPVIVEGQRFHAIHAADGTPLTMVPDREVAFATVRQHEMEPASVH